MQNYWSDKGYFEQRIRDLEVLIAIAKKNNENRQRLLAQKEEVKELAVGLHRYVDKLKVILARTTKENNVVKLVLTDAWGNVFYPRMGNGMLVQYLTSFAAVSCITRTLGYKNLFIDEAFGCSSMNNLPVIGQLLGDLVSSGMQIVCVSQNPALYQDLPRHEICLEMNKEGTGVLMKEKDFV